VGDEQAVVDRRDRQPDQLVRVDRGGQLAALDGAAHDPGRLLVAGSEEVVQRLGRLRALHGRGHERRGNRAQLGVGEPALHQPGHPAQVVAERAGVGDRPGLVAGQLQRVGDEPFDVAPPPVDGGLVDAGPIGDVLHGQAAEPVGGQLGQGRLPHGVADAGAAPAGSLARLHRNS